MRLTSFLRSPAPRVPPGVPRSLSLALQGGGSFGAFTWGVLDRLLDEPRLPFDAVSGSSAGAINAALLASGLANGGRAGAQTRLERFWRRASGAAPAAPLGYALAAAARVFSPYSLNPLDLNPLRTILDQEVDVDALRTRSPVRLLLGATRVADGRLRVFRETEVSVDVLLASACLPLLHQAVTIGGDAYWDGGYAANPPLLPLVDASRAADILVVQVIPSAGRDLPRSPPEIQRRLDHLTFNASLVRDLDLLGRPGERDAGAATLHRIAAEDHHPDLGHESALRLDWSFLNGLREAGRAAADRWLADPAGYRASIEAGRPSPAAQSASSPARKVG